MDAAVRELNEKGVDTEPVRMDQVYGQENGRFFMIPTAAAGITMNEVKAVRPARIRSWYRAVIRFHRGTRYR